MDSIELMTSLIKYSKSVVDFASQLSILSVGPESGRTDGGKLDASVLSDCRVLHLARLFHVFVHMTLHWCMTIASVDVLIIFNHIRLESSTTSVACVATLPKATHRIDLL